jgi:type II secretory ATPase GspE/PulE/Tfp pilus assembly ATPase PilB-like protein
VLKKRLGELMIKRGFATDEQVRRLLERHRSVGGLLGTLAVNEGVISEQQLKRLLAEQAGVKPVPEDFEFYPKLAELLPVRQAKKYGVVPLKEDRRYLAIGTAEPQNVPVLDELAFVTGKEIVPYLMLEMELADALDLVYADATKTATQPDHPNRPPPPTAQTILPAQPTVEPMFGGYMPGAESPVTRLVGAALDAGAEFIHLQDTDGNLYIRFRRVGVLEPAPFQLPTGSQTLFNQLKVLAGLPTSERNQLLKGHFRLNINGNGVSVSATFTPTARGERTVLRLETHRTGVPTFEELAVPEKLAILLREASEGRHGLIILSGPPFSRKKDLAYAVMAGLDGRSRAILTVEEHTTFSLDELDTLRPRPGEGITYADAVEAALEQDPDVLFVDELTSTEVANALIGASYARILVILRLSSSGILSAILALKEVGKEPFLFASSLALVTSQRELRRLCPHCKRPYKATKAVLESLHIAATRPFTFHEAPGCEECHHTGSSSTVLIYEHLVPNAQIRQLLAGDLSIEELSRAARRAGLRSTREVGLELALSGEVSVVELLRLT